MYAKIKTLLLKLVSISAIFGDADSSQHNLLKKIRLCWPKEYYIIGHVLCGHSTYQGHGDGKGQYRGAN